MSRMLRALKQIADSPENAARSQALMPTAVSESPAAVSPRPVSTPAPQAEAPVRVEAPQAVATLAPAEAAPRRFHAPQPKFQIAQQQAAERVSADHAPLSSWTRAWELAVQASHEETLESLEEIEGLDDVDPLACDMASLGTIAELDDADLLDEADTELETEAVSAEPLMPPTARPALPAMPPIQVDREVIDAAWRDVQRRETERRDAARREAEQREIEALEAARQTSERRTPTRASAKARAAATINEPPARAVEPALLEAKSAVSQEQELRAEQERAAALQAESERLELARLESSDDDRMALIRAALDSLHGELTEAAPAQRDDVPPFLIQPMTVSLPQLAKPEPAQETASIAAAAPIETRSEPRIELPPLKVATVSELDDLPTDDLARYWDEIEAARPEPLQVSDATNEVEATSFKSAADSASDERAAAEYATLAMNLLARSPSRGPRSIAILSADVASADALDASRLAKAFAQAMSDPVLLVDGRWRAAELARDLGGQWPEVSESPVPLGKLIVPTDVPRLSLLPFAGRSKEDLLADGTLDAVLLARCKRTYPLVLVEVGSPESAWALPLAQQADYAFLAVTVAHSHRAVTARVVAQLQRSGIRLAGVVALGSR